MKLISEKISYRDLGKGQPLVLLHGLGRAVGHWNGFDEMLAKHCRVIAIENRGLGFSRSADLKWNASVKDYCVDICAVLDDAGIDRAHIAGVSLGGMMALGCGIYFPKRCQSLMVINSSIASSPLRLTPRAAIAIALAGLLPRKKESFLAALLVSHEAEARDILAKNMQKVSDDSSLSAKLVISQLIAAGKFYTASDLQQMHVPTHVVVGDADKFVPTFNSETIHKKIWKSKLTRIAGGGHEIWHDKPAELRDIILEQIKEFNL